MNQEKLNALLAAGARYGASDVHLKVDDPPLFRINGLLTPIQHDRLRPTDLDALAQIVGRARDPNIRVADLQDLDCSYQVEGVGRFRVNVYRQRGVLSIVMRFIPREVPTIDAMLLPPALKKIAETERGLILVTGATGSGKSSTLAAMIRHINSTRRCHILTIEDPIEFLHTSNVAVVSQRELGSDTKTFGGALRSALRQDPDVIMVGEMRDAESIDIGLKAGETGHVVYSTVHTTDAAKTLGRLLGVFPAEEQRTVTYRIADTLKATISQRLLPRADGRGRVAACEIMVVTNTIREHLADGRPASGLKDLMQRGGDSGMQTFDQHLSKLYQAGIITLQAAMEASTNPADFQRALHFQ
ncbi:MAG: type IV pilus twitching motility protein PilT [Polyangiales bacterium]